MNFRPELAEAVVRGKKTVTRRAVSSNPRSPWFVDRCSLKVGGRYAVCPGRGKHAIGYVTVVDVKWQRLGRNLTPAEARREGFSSPAEFRRVWEEINGSWNDDDLVWRVEFAIDLADQLKRSLAHAGATA